MLLSYSSQRERAAIPVERMHEPAVEDAEAGHHPARRVTLFRQARQRRRRDPAENQLTGFARR